MTKYNEYFGAGSIEELDAMAGWSSLSIKLDFPIYHPHSDYSYKTRNNGVSKDAWPIIVPRNAPAVIERTDFLRAQLLPVTKKLWTMTEPDAGQQRRVPGRPGQLPPTIGTRGGPQPPPNPGAAGYSPQVRPTTSIMGTQLGNDDVIATDWWLTRELERTNAVTFRGDKRPPDELHRAEGFKPPDTREDEKYLTEQVYVAFADYLQRRYGRVFDPQAITTWYAEFRRAIPTDEMKSLLYQYTVWRALLRSEAAHIGRMTDNELLKGFISTSRSIDSASAFAKANGTDGWVYVAMVHSGYVVPYSSAGQQAWGTKEAEIAQFGKIPWDRIVGFMKFSHAKKRPVSPIFLRRTFREQEPKACGQIYKIMSGMTPDIMIGKDKPKKT